MDICKNIHCKKKLGEYWELTSKLYDDISSFEDDMKDKDDFLQNVVKARNTLQEEVANIKKRNVNLSKENTGLLEKVKQLDEDTDDGLKMLQNAHERERKLNRTVDEHKEMYANYRENNFELIKENDNMKLKITFVKDKYKKSIRENQKSLDLKEVKIRNLEEVLVGIKTLFKNNDT